MAVSVFVVLTENNTGLRVHATVSPGQKAALSSVVIIGRGEPGKPSDHVPSYAPTDLNETMPQFTVELLQGVAIGSLAFKVDGQDAWSGIFHRFPIKGGQAASFVFADQACTLDVPSSIASDRSVVIVRAAGEAGPDGKPCDAYHISDVNDLLDGVPMMLHLAIAGDLDPQTMGVWRRPLNGAAVWECIPNGLAAGQAEVTVPITGRGVVAFGPRC